MDFVTHAAVGALVGRAIARDDPPLEGRALARLGALAALAPDADHVLELVSAEAYLVHHRTATHALVTCGAAVLLSLAWPGDGRRRRAGVIAGALASHLLLDLLTPFGTGLLWPFSESMPALDGLPIVAPFCLAVAALGAFLGLRGGQRASRLALAGLAAFLALEMVIARRAENALAHEPVALAIPALRSPLEATVFTADARQVRRYRVGALGEPVLLSTIERGVVPPSLEDGPGARAFSRLRLPVVRASGDQVLVEDAQLDAVVGDATADPVTGWGLRPVRIVVRADGAYAVEQRPLGLQPLLWAAVVLAAAGGGRLPGLRASSSGLPVVS